MNETGHQNPIRKEFEKARRETVRLNKFLADCGICSRREADRLVEAGRVTVDGRAALAGQRVSDRQDIRVDEKRVHPEREMILLAVNKPRGVVCTTDKTWGDTTVEELIAYPRRVFYAGRLDKDSEGLLLMTNDGRLQDRLMRAVNFHEKEYLVCVDRPVDEAFLKKMAQGVYLRELDVTTRPCRIEKTGRRQFRIILTQGLNRQIRRMCRELGYRAETIRRLRIMNITLDGLKAGEYREVTDGEMKLLYESLKKDEK